MKHFDLICPRCKAEVLETTDKFVKGPVNGTMFRHKEGFKVKSRHDAITHVRGQNFQCPMCLQPVCTPGGNVLLRDRGTGTVFLSNEDPPKSVPYHVPLFTDAALKKEWERRTLKTQKPARKRKGKC